MAGRVSVKIYAGRRRNELQYRIEKFFRLSDSDGYNIGEEKHHGVNFTFQEVIDSPEEVRKYLGQTGLDFLNKVIEFKGDTKIKFLHIASSWQINILFEDGDDVEAIEEVILTALAALSLRGLLGYIILPETTSVGSVLL